MSAVISWTMAAYEDAVRYLLIEHVLFAVEMDADPAIESVAVAVAYESVAEARETAIKQTQADDEAGYTLDGGVRLSRTTVELTSLVYAYRDRSPVYPVLHKIVADAMDGVEL